MKTLNYETLNEIGYDGYLLKDAPERVLQFGEGNFLRAFVDYFIDMLNEKPDSTPKSYSVSRSRRVLPTRSTNRRDFTHSICADFRMVRKSTKSGSFPVSADA